jgi:hypothetical protein
MGRDTRGVGQAKLPAQGDDGLTVEVSDAEIHVKHRASFMIRQPGGSAGPAANSLKPDVDGHRVSRMTDGE